MCGIEFLLGSDARHACQLAKAFEASFSKGLVTHRGPDDTTLEQTETGEGRTICWGFRRRMIQGLDVESNEPLHLDHLTLVCNGEVYNHRHLKAEHPQWKIRTHNDCEVILHLYETYGIEETMKRLDGEFAFILHDAVEGTVYMARDHLGVRPLYLGEVCVEGKMDDSDNTKDYANHFVTVGFLAASELEGLTGVDLPPEYVLINPKQLEPRKIYCFVENLDSYITWTYAGFPSYVKGKTPDHKHLKDLLYDEVRKRVSPENRDVPCVFTLSGGLDSTLVTLVGVDILTKEFGVDPSTIRAYCVGKEGSPDRIAARQVAAHLAIDLKEVEVSDEDMVGMVDLAIRRGGTFCRTTIRAMCPHLLVAKAIAEDTLSDGSKPIVVLSGEVADEIWGSYAYFAKAPSPAALAEEGTKLTEDIYLSDGLRADRAIAAYGLELRVPYSGKPFVDYVLSLDPTCKVFSSSSRTFDSSSSSMCEKTPIRQAFVGCLPSHLLWRRKNGMSDAVSSSETSWVDGLLAWIDTQVKDEEVPEGFTKERFYYAKRFYEMFCFYKQPKPAREQAFAACLKPGCALTHLSSRDGPFDLKTFLTLNREALYEWMPNPTWCPEATDPSGRQGLGDLCLAD